MVTQVTETPFSQTETPETQPIAPAETPQQAPAEPSVADLKAQLAKLENDLKAERGRGKPVDEIRTLVNNLRTEINDRDEVLQRTVSAFARAIASDDPEQRSQAVKVADDAQMELQKKRGALTMASVRQGFADEITAALTDDDGNPVVPWNSPELANSVGLFQRGDAAQNPQLWAQALTEANKVRRAIDRAKAAQAVKDAEKRGEESAKAAVRKAANLDNGAPAPAGTPGRRTLEQISKVDTRGMSAKQLQELDAEWEAAARR